MAQKPELIIFNQYKIGGVQSFYYNILKYAPSNSFEINWLFLNNPDDSDPKPKKDYNLTNETVIKLESKESKYSIAKKLDKVVTHNKGIVITNFDEELSFLHLYRRKSKTIIFICHDVWYVHRALRYEFLIDLFIAHNKSFYTELLEKMPHRKKDIFYMPYGVKIPEFKRKQNKSDNLKIVIAARLQESKGIHYLPLIDDLLVKNNINVSWTIIGDGPEKQKLINDTADKKNFNFITLPDNEAVLCELKNNDVFILPSRIEGLPVSMLEAMSVGCVPIVAKFNSGILDIIKSEIGYVVEIGNNEGFYFAIKELHDNRDLLEEKSNTSRLKIETYYDIEKRSKDYMSFFEKNKNYKKPYIFKFPNYGGYADNPWVPKLFRWSIKKLRRMF